MNKLSVVIITFNEERNIERVINSVEGIADEIIVVDSFSTDDTKVIAEKYQIRFIQKDWMGYAATKNFANDLSRHEYIFSIDADEEVDDQLSNQIRKEKELGFKGVYTINRLTNYCGKWIKHSGWYPDYKIRIFPKSKTKWVGDYVHEELGFTEELSNKKLSGHLNHYSYYDYKDHRMRADKYSILTAKKMASQGKKAGVLKPYISALGRFISMYFIKLGFLDGWKGFKIAQISAASNVLKYKELRRLNKEE